MAEYELTMYGSSELSHKTKLEDMQATYTNVKEQLKQRTTQLSDLKRSIQQTEQSLIDTRTKLNQVNNDERKMIDIVRKKRASLIEVKSTFHAKQSRSKVLEALMAQKRNGNCSGLFGRLVIIVFYFFGYFFGYFECFTYFFRVIWVQLMKNMILLFRQLVDHLTIWLLIQWQRHNGVLNICENMMLVARLLLYWRNRNI